MADARIEDAQALLAAGRWSAGYYLSGYAVECGLKACIIALVERRPGIVSEVKDFSGRFFKHDPERLLRLAELWDSFQADCLADRELRDNWLVVDNWSEESRYESWTEPQARNLFDSVTTARGGILPWLRSHW